MEDFISSKITAYVFTGRFHKLWVADREREYSIRIKLLENLNNEDFEKM